MNKLLPLKNKTLILAVPVILIIAAAVILAFKMYFVSKAVKESKAPQPARASAQPRPVKGSQTAGRTESKKPEINSAAALQGSVPKAAAPAPYEYNSRGRRDPFASLLVQVETEKRKGAPPIESYELSDFKLTAILWNKSGFYALVLSPDGKDFTLREGTTIGLHSGKVYKITTDSVIIREFLKDYRGVVRPQDFVFKLHRGEEG